MKAIWRWILRIMVAAIAFLGVTVIALAAWLLFYTRDLPDISKLREYAPADVRPVRELCGTKMYSAVPHTQLSQRFQPALAAAEGKFERAGVGPYLYRVLHPELGQSARVSAQIARHCFCELGRGRQLKEIRTALQIERRYSIEEQIITYANIAYFGNEIFGAEPAAQFYYHKPVQELTTAEADMVAGLIRAPNMYSPFRHPDCALQRRNEVIQRMAENKSLSDVDAQRAMTAPLM